MNDLILFNPNNSKIHSNSYPPWKYEEYKITNKQLSNQFVPNVQFLINKQINKNQNIEITRSNSFSNFHSNSTPNAKIEFLNNLKNKKSFSKSYKKIIPQKIVSKTEKSSKEPIICNYSQNNNTSSSKISTKTSLQPEITGTLVPKLQTNTSCFGLANYRQFSKSDSALENSDEKTNSRKPPMKRNKSVTFADTRGQELAQIFYFSKQDSFLLANDILISPLICETEKQISKKYIFSEFEMNDPFEMDSPTLELINGPSCPEWSISRNFAPPYLNPNFSVMLETKKVMLESTRLDSRGGMVRGNISVVNLAFEKTVIARWTRDNWLSVHESLAKFTHSFTLTDNFSFTLPLNIGTIEFAIMFNCDGKDYWDNNNGSNYSVTIYSI